MGRGLEEEVRDVNRGLVNQGLTEESRWVWWKILLRVFGREPVNLDFL